MFPTPSLPSPRRSLRPRSRTPTRIAMSLLTFAVLAFLFNEIRCRDSGAGCVVTRHLAPYGPGEAGFISGGAVLRPTPAAAYGLGIIEGGRDGGEGKGQGEKEGKSVWGTHGVVGGWFFKPRNRTAETSTATATFALAGSNGAPVRVEGQEELDVVLPMHDVVPAGRFHAHGEAGGEGEGHDIAFSAQMAREKELYFESGRVDPVTQGPESLGLGLASPPSSAIAVEGVQEEGEDVDDREEEWVYAEQDDNAKGDAYTGSAAEDHARWEQGEGMEDPVRVLVSSASPSSSSSRASSSGSWVSSSAGSTSHADADAAGAGSARWGAMANRCGGCRSWSLKVWAPGSMSQRFFFLFFFSFLFALLPFLLANLATAVFLIFFLSFLLFSFCFFPLKLCDKRLSGYLSIGLQRSCTVDPQDFLLCPSLSFLFSSPPPPSQADAWETVGHKTGQRG